MRGVFSERPDSAPLPSGPGTIDPSPTWVKVGAALSYTTFQAAATSKSNTLFSLLAAGIVSGIYIKHSQAFAGPALATVTMEIGIAGTTTKYAAAFDVMQAVSGTAFGLTSVSGTESYAAETNILITARSTGANLSVLTAGVVDVWALLSKLP